MKKIYGECALRTEVKATMVAFLLAGSASALSSLGDNYVMMTECIHENTIMTLTGGTNDFK